MPGFYSTEEERAAREAEEAAAAQKWAAYQGAGGGQLDPESWLRGGEAVTGADPDPVVLTTPEGRQVRQSQIAGLAAGGGDLSPEALDQILAGMEQTGEIGTRAPDPVVYTTPDGRQIRQSQVGGLTGLGGNDLSPAALDQILGGVEQTGQIGTPSSDPAYREAEVIPDAPPDPREGDFGDDLDWLNPAFQQAAPTREQALSLGTTGDELARDAQVGAAEELFGLYQQGGRGAQDRAERAAARRDTEGWLRGQREADMQNLAERGMAGSGAEIATLLGDRQDAGERMSAADLTADSQAEQRALQALLSGTDVMHGIQAGADDYVQGNQRMLADIEGSNKDFLRKSYAGTQERRSAQDMHKLGLQVGTATDKAAADRAEQKYGYTHGTEVAGADTDAFNDKQGLYNQSKLGAFTGYMPQATQAAQNRIGYTGGTAAAAGQSASGGVNAVLSILGRYGGNKGGNTKKTEDEE